MDLERAKAIIEQIHSAGLLVETSPATESNIAALEQRLNCRLPNSYRTFLAEFGSIYCQGITLSGLHSNPRDLGCGSIIGDTQRLAAQGLPEHLLVVQPDEAFDQPDCLDMSAFQEDEDGGECPVICFQMHTSHTRVLASTFGDYFVDHFLPSLLDLAENG